MWDYHEFAWYTVKENLKHSRIGDLCEAGGNNEIHRFRIVTHIRFKIPRLHVI